MSCIDRRSLGGDAAVMAMALDTLAYARRLREAGFSEQQAEGQAQALAAAMTDSLATKQDLHELEARLDARFAAMDGRFAAMDARLDGVDARFDYQERHFDLKLDELEKRLEIRFAEQAARFGGSLADLERRMTLRLGGITVAGIGVVSALVRIL